MVLTIRAGHDRSVRLYAGPGSDAAVPPGDFDRTAAFAVFFRLPGHSWYRVPAAQGRLRAAPAPAAG